MYLSKLELHGFKSFAERTSLQFDPGVTAVVGPNGCGKSNIVDAVRWVIGEQRARILRSDKMESVIFNGTAKKRPLGMAEVMLTVENNRGVLPIEYNDITIGRRLFRSGESEYLLNGVQCRLKDITDLFMDTGMGAGAYSVIELKMIEEILSENANDRRRLFEEAAGITRYKSRRAQALRKLDNTQADLQRLRDLLDEIEKRVRSLKRQARKATRYKEVSTRLRLLELSLSRVEFDRLAEQKVTLQKEMEALRVELEGQIARHGESEAALEAMKLALLEREESFSAAQGALRAHLESVQRIESEIRLRDERIESGRRDLQRSQREQTESNERISELDTESAKLRDLIAQLQPEVDASVARLATAAAERDRAHAAADVSRASLSSLRTAAQERSDDVAERLRLLDRQNSRVELLETDRATAVAGLEQIESDVSQLRAQLTAAREAAHEQLTVTEAARQSLTVALENESRRTAELAQQKELLEEHQRKAEAASAEMQLLESLVSSYEDASDAVRFLAEDRGWSDVELRTVADVVTCDDRYRPAVEAALASYADYVVVRSDAELQRAVAKLRAADRGRATFVVLDRLSRGVSGEGGAAESTPVVGAIPMARLIRTLAPEYDTLVRILLRDLWFVSELPSDATFRPGASATGAVQLINDAGEWVNDLGATHAGSVAAARSVSPRLGRREQLEQTRAQHEALLGAIAAQQQSVAAAEAALIAVEVESARILLADRERGTMDAQARANQAQYELEVAVRRRDELSARIAEIDASTRALGEEISAINTSVEEDLRALGDLKSQVEAAEEDFHATESDSRVALALYSEASVSTVELKNRFENLQRDLERAAAEQENLRRKVADRTEHITAVEASIRESVSAREALRVDLAEVKSGREELEVAVDNARNRLHDGRSEISAIEHTLREIRRLKEEHQRAENQRAVKLAEVKTREEELVRHIDEDYGVNVAEVTVEDEAIADEAAARREVVDLRRQTRNMGPINELALEEYEEEQQRFEFMSKQLADLTAAEKTLLDTIDEINTTASNRFMETFGAIQENFEKLFAELFGSETSAKVILEDPDKPLESAIEVMARPKGKRPSVLAQLSGGEKTLTAIALLFAIYLVKPSPFCILDEVDAPLDDANIGRFMKIIQEFAKSTQFILVTHNKKTMEAADRMYGVTMQEQGVSSLVGVKLEQVEG